MDDGFWVRFMMYDYKIQMCRRDGCRVCMFAHPGDPIRRRDHSRRHYRWEPCHSFLRNGVCPHGDLCEFSHGNCEMWYHPVHYRVYPCPYARNCSLDLFCPYAQTLEEFRGSLSVPVYSYHRPRFAAQGSSSLLVNCIYHWPRLARQNSFLLGSSSSAAADSNQRPRLADQGTSSSAAADRNQRPRLADQGTSSSVAGAAYSNRQAAQGSPSSALVVYGTLQPSPPMMQRPRSPQRHQLTDSSGAIPHLQAEHDHEAGSSNN